MPSRNPSNNRHPNSKVSAARIRPTPRELVILEWLVQDLTNVQIARRCKVSEQTIKTYMRRLISLTKVNTRVGLAVAFVRWREMGQSNPYWDEPAEVYAQMGGRSNEQS